MPEIRVLIADDFDAWRIRIHQILKTRSEWQIVFEAQDGWEAVQKTLELEPDIVLPDIDMPKVNGIEAAQRIRRQRPDTKIIFLSQIDASDIRMAALDWADAYVLKANAASELLPAITAAIRWYCLSCSQAYTAPELAALERGCCRRLLNSGN
jgi:DNA-binding NarL/FixJ family response regulator